MTPLKFRAWHKTPCYDNKNSIDFGKCSMTYWEMGSGLDNSWFFKNALAVMQSTGLKDKNGKEIFEGDIVMWPDTESEYVDVGVGEVKVAETSANTWGPVVFKDAAFGIESPGGEVAKKGWYSLKEFLYDYCPPEDIEVIGNIYENPDLLPTKGPTPTPSLPTREPDGCFVLPVTIKGKRVIISDYTIHGLRKKLEALLKTDH